MKIIVDIVQEILTTTRLLEEVQEVEVMTERKVNDTLYVLHLNNKIKLSLYQNYTP